MRGSAAHSFPRRPLAPLALTLGLHLLLVLAWMNGASPGLQRELAERVSTFVLVQPLPASRPKPSTSAAVPRPRARLPVPVPVPVQASAPVAPAASEAVDAAPLPDAPPAPSPALPGDLLASSRRMAGGVDRALRNGSSPITAEPDRKWERFATAFAAARTSVYRDTILESYTAGDGVTIYRKTVGDRAACYRSGSAGGLGPADGHSAGNIRCPTGASWTRL
ncbi:hypothetical protein [Massilia niabensis]|uniref:Uncharacterized protein n=1 Tax=Massilia niabensis TaxID=544910 RepID=A0ABW0KZ80_9BURK